MDIIGGAASVSQLVVYLSSSAVSLQRLYTELAHSDSTYRDKATNIELLLHTLQRLSRHHIDDHNPVLPVLISISGIACQVLNLLEPKRAFGINWASVISRERINSAFETLNEKRNLLHLHISQSHQDALVDLKQTLESSCSTHHTTISTKEEDEKLASQTTQDTATATVGAPPNQTAPGQAARFTLSMSDCNIAGYNRVMNRAELPPEADVTLEKLHVERYAINSVANDNEDSEETKQQIVHLNAGTLVHNPTYTTLPAQVGLQNQNMSSNRSTASRQTSSSRLQHPSSRSSGQSSSDDGSLYDAEGAQSGVSLVPESPQMRNMDRFDSGIDMGSNMESEDGLEGVPSSNVPQNAPEKRSRKLRGMLRKKNASGS